MTIALTGAFAAPSGAGITGEGVPAFGHVFLIIGENTVCAVLSPLVAPGSYPGKTYAYSVLRVLEDGFRLPAYLGFAAAVSPLPVTWKAG